MGKNNKFLCLLFCGVISVATVGLGACTQGGGKGVIPITPPAVEQEQASLSLNMKKMTLPLFGSATIVATLKHSTQTIVWKSSDESVVTVENGEIYGLKEGTATISATAGELSESCTVTVTKEGVQTQFAMLEDGMTLYLGSPYKLDPTVISNGKVVEGLQVSFITEGDVFTVDAEGNLTALKEGAQTITATASLNGETILSESFTVNICEYLSIKTGIEKNTLQLKLTDYLADSLTEYSVADFKAIIGLEIRDDVALEYKVEDGTVAKIENQKILPLKVGETTVFVSFTSPTTQNKHVANIKVVVEKEVVEKSTDFLAKSATGTRKDDFQNNVTGDTFIDLSGTDIDLSTLTAIREKGKTLVANANGNTLIVTDASCGEVQLEVELEKVIYTIDGFIAQTIISNKAELQKFYSQYGSIYGYTVLADDIDMGGDVLNGGSQWFRCIFDGRGHTISNFTTPYGIITYLSEGALIKNVQYVNVVKDAGDITVLDKNDIGAYGFFGYSHTGSVQDVLIVGTIKNPAKEQAVFSGGEYSQASYKNIVVAFDVENAKNTTLVGTGNTYSGTGKKNIFDNIRYVYDGEMTPCKEFSEEKDALHYTSVSAYVESQDFNGFDGYWNIEENELPTMGDLTGAFEGSVIIVNGDLEPGKTVLVSTTMACSEITLKNAVDGVTVDGKTLTIGENVALGTTIALVVSNSLNDVTIEKEYIVRVAETLTYGEKYVDAMGGKGKLDLSKLDKTIGAVQSVTINGIEYECETKDGILYYDTAEVGEITVVLNTEDFVYTVEVLQADNVLTTWEEFKAWATTANGTYNTYEYTVLANDITASGMTYSNGGYFSKTFDGLGHTIDKFVCGHGIVQRLLAGATWKNVNYTNITINDQGVFGYLAGGTFENVNISGTLTSDRILTYGMNNSNTKIVNCTFNLTKADNATVYLAKGEIHYYYITLVNSTVNYSGTVSYETCPCGSCANSKPSRITLTNSTVNSNYKA